MRDLLNELDPGKEEIMALAQRIGLIERRYGCNLAARH
jgi:hypothetical protein